MKVTFGGYWPVALLLGIPFLWWMAKHTATRLSPQHLNLLAAVRTAVIVLLALALMRPVWHRPGRWLSVVFALDVSGSIAPSFIDSSLKWVAAAVKDGSPGHARFLAFASDAMVVEKVEELSSVPIARGDSAPPGALDPRQTNIEQALSRALSSFEPNSLKHLVLITDGRETRGNLSRSLRQAERNGVRIFTVPAPVRGETDSWIEAVEVPHDVRAGASFEVMIQVFSRAPQVAMLELDHVDGRSLARQPIELPAGPSQVPFEIRFEETGSVAIEARLTAELDPFPDNNRQRQSIWIAERPKLLYVEGNPASARYLADALEDEGFEVTTATASGLPGTAEALEAYDAVILSDISASRLDEQKMRSLRSYVRDTGGGLIFIGGESSYGAAGYSETPVEEALPVRFSVKEKRKEVALVITLDKSYSMEGEKIELAKEACKAALDLLDDTHYFGLVTFDWYPKVTVPLQLANDKPRIRETIGKIKASAPTRIYPALEEAHKQLADSEAKVKHIIVLSDGMSYRLADGGESLIKDMVADEITISTVAVGLEADRELLGNIARWGNGRTYFTEEASQVPEIFIREAEIAVQDTLLEEPFRPKVTQSIEALKGIDFDAAPLLKGYVGTLPKETAEVLLESESGDPILARWHYGLGKAVAFTSDAKNRWASNWLTWDGYGKFWAQLVRKTMRQQDPSQLDLRVAREEDKAVVTLNALDPEGRFLNGIEPQIGVVAPDGSESSQSILQVGPGSYRIELPLAADPDSPNQFDLKSPASFDKGGDPIRSDAVFYSFPDEYRFHPPNVELLQTISRRTGGLYEPKIEDIFSDQGDSVTRPTPLWPFLAGLALFLYLVDIGVRRVPWLWKRFQQD